MKDWKLSLDRYLLSESDNHFDSWAENVIEYLSDDFYMGNEDWVMEYSGVCNNWLNKLFNKSTPIKKAAAIIERAHRVYFGK